MLHDLRNLKERSSAVQGRKRRGSIAMGQTLGSCCNCFRSISAGPNSNGAKWKKSPFDDKKIELDEDDVKKPLVVVEDDESWKKWSSYNLIHSAAVQKKDETYRPPSYISQRVSAEATWDL